MGGPSKALGASRGLLVTGGTGFVGRALLRRLRGGDAYRLVAAVRGESDLPSDVEVRLSEGLTGGADWSAVLQGISRVVHAAARVHVMQETAADPLSEFRRTNVAGTLNLARQAAAAGVKRFVFLSSIKVNGEASVPGVPWSTEAAAAPRDPYGVSKWEAEDGLRKLAHQTGMEVVIIRPPLVYGPGVKGNFLTLMRLLQRGLPLPLGAIHNRRSLVALDNLVDLIVTCLEHPAAANEIFLVSDGEDLSTSDLLRRLAAAMSVPARLLPVPSWMLEAGAAALGRRGVAQRLCGDLQVDISKTRELLGWSPPITVDEGLRRTAAGFRG